MYKEGTIAEDIYYLVCGPLRTVRRYSGYIVNGFRFHTIDRQDNLKTQNSGVMVRGDDVSQKKYYGVLKDVYELQYPGRNHVIVFKCGWYDVQHQGRGYKRDEFGITSLCADQSLNTQEPFVLESQVVQVFYVREPRDTRWVTVIETEPRDLYNIPEINTDEHAVDEVDIEAVQQPHSSRGTILNMTAPEQGYFGEDIRLATNHYTVEKGADIVKWVTKELQDIQQQKKGKEKNKNKKRNIDLDDFIVDDDVEI